MWSGQLVARAADMPRTEPTLGVSAHRGVGPVSLSASHAPLVPDFGGFAPRYYGMTYETPDATAPAQRVAAMTPSSEPVHQHTPPPAPDHGAWVPLRIMYPEADAPVLRMSLPTRDPVRLLALGERLRPLRDEGVLVIGSGFHPRPAVPEGAPYRRPGPRLVRRLRRSGRRGARPRRRRRAGVVRRPRPSMPYAHPSVEHHAPLFVTLGAATEPAADTPVIGGSWTGLSKRSPQVARALVVPGVLAPG